MIELFSMDEKDLNPDWKVVARPSVRGIVIRDDKVLLVYSKKFDYYKFPGGGIENNESHEDTLKREVLEECGYKVISGSIKEYGRVSRRQRDTYEENCIFDQQNYYYFCDVEDEQVEQKLDAYESDEEFTPVWVTLLEAHSHNRKNFHGTADPVMIKRDTKILDMLDISVRKSTRAKKESEWLEKFGHPEYFEMLDFVEEQLMDKPEEFHEKKRMNYVRFDHIKRVLSWVVRLYNTSENKEAIDLDKVIVATIFHDVGKKMETVEISHATLGDKIAREYLLEHGYSKERTEAICELIYNHSDKYLMYQKDITPDLMLIMEADLMDDMGALGIVIDCMVEGCSNPDSIFTDSLDHIARYTLRQQKRNPMVTPNARKIWDEKTKLVNDFYQSLQYDIEIFR